MNAGAVWVGARPASHPHYYVWEYDLFREVRPHTLSSLSKPGEGGRFVFVGAHYPGSRWKRERDLLLTLTLQCIRGYLPGAKNKILTTLLPSLLSVGLDAIGAVTQ